MHVERLLMLLRTLCAALCALFFSTLGSAEPIAPPVDIALASGPAERSSLTSQVYLRVVMQFAAEMQSHMTAQDKSEIADHQQESLVMSAGKTYVRSWKNANGIQWTHTMAIDRAYIDTDRQMLCKAFRETLAIAGGPHAYPPANRSGAACKPLKKGIMVEGPWKLDTLNAQRTRPHPNEAELPKK